MILCLEMRVITHIKNSDLMATFSIKHRPHEIPIAHEDTQQQQLSFFFN